MIASPAAATVLLLISVITAGAVPVSAMDAESLASVWKATNPRIAELVTIQFEPRGGVLKVGRKFELNPLRHMIQTQSVRIKDLEPTPIIDSVGSRIEPWVKLRVRGNRESVQVNEDVFVEGMLLELESKEEKRSVVVFECDPYEVARLAEALEKFLSAH